MKRHSRVQRMVRIGAVAAVLASGALAAGCGSSGSSSASVDKTVLTWAEAPQTPPNYIFPFAPLQFFSVATLTQFQMLMYRPLYWFGKGANLDLNLDLSIGKQPTYSADGKSVTVDLNAYKWSNGTSVTSQNVLFWMNMLHAEKSNWAGYAQGALPDDLVSVTAPSATQVVFTMNAPVNENWFTYNELSQITPMPDAWDITAVGGTPNSGGCAKAAYGTADAACTAVFTFLSKQAGWDPANPKGANNSLSTYATNPIWAVVDGPWKLTHFDASGNITFTANKTYSGPVKPSVSTFKEVPFTSDSAEFNALVNNQVDVGFLPAADITQGTTNALKAGPNNPRLADNYTMDPLYTWSINYFPYNFNSTGDDGNAGKIFSQLYFRQAMQSLVDQDLYNKKIGKGYGVGTYGPVPVLPANSFVSSLEKNNPYPYSPTKAVSLLKDHGWTVVPGGTSTCASPGTGPNQCGAGIPAGAKLAFNLEYASGADALTQLMTAEKSSWAQAGINITLSQASFNTVLGNAVPCSGGSNCSWELENWGAGWLFSPDYYPSGEPIFQTGAGSNSGSYSDPTNDANITASITTQTPLTTYENYLAQQLPGVWQPNSVTSLTEVVKGLHGVIPQNPLWAINPEEWRF